MIDVKIRLRVSFELGRKVVSVDIDSVVHGKPEVEEVKLGWEAQRAVEERMELISGLITLDNRRN